MGDFNIFHHMPWAATYSIYFFVIGISAALFFFSTLSWFSDAFVPIRMKAFLVSFGLLAISGLSAHRRPCPADAVHQHPQPDVSQPYIASGMGRLESDVLRAGVGALLPRDVRPTPRCEGAGRRRISARPWPSGLYGLRPYGAPESPGLEHAADAGAVRGHVACFGCVRRCLACQRRRVQCSACCARSCCGRRAPSL